MSAAAAGDFVKHRRRGDARPTPSLRRRRAETGSDNSRNACHHSRDSPWRGPGRAQLPVATKTSGETKGATDWANSIAVH
jgi:hypothetical protein